MKKASEIFKKLIIAYFLALAPLILFGLYKNGIRPYQKGLISFLSMFKPLIILMLGAAGAICGSILREVRSGEKLDFKIIKKGGGNILEAVLAVSILPLKSSPIVVFLVTFLTSAFLNKIKLNRIALMYIAIEGINVLFGLNNFFNAYDESTILNYDGIDLFFGFGPGGMFSTSVLFIFIGLVALSFNKLYKKETALSSVCTFAILGVITHMITGDYGNILPYLFGYNVLFVLVFIAPNLYSSCYTVKGQVLSGIMIGILSFGLSYVTPYTSAVIAILFASLFKGVFDRIFVIK